MNDKFNTVFTPACRREPGTSLTMPSEILAATASSYLKRQSFFFNTIHIFYGAHFYTFFAREHYFVF